MIVDFGMSDKFRNMTLGKGVLGNPGGEPVLIREFSEETQKFIDDEIAHMIDERYKKVLALLSEHKELLEYIASRLQKVETMDGKEFAEIVNAEKNLNALAVPAENAAEPAEQTAAEENAAAETAPAEESAEAGENA